MTKDAILVLMRNTLEGLAGERVAQGGPWPDGTVQVEEALVRLIPVATQASTEVIPGETYGQHAARLGEGPCLRCVGHAVTGGVEGGLLPGEATDDTALGV